MPSTKKIVIADRMEKDVVEKLRAIGEVRYLGEPAAGADKAAELKAALGDADALIVRSATVVTPELIAGAKKLRIVARAGVGLDNVKLSADYCKQRGISVINTPAASTRAVAELTIAFIGAMMRKVGYAHARLQAGVWEKSQCTGAEPDGKTLGIIGMGRIGREVARRAEAGYEMKIVYNDLLKSDDLPYEYYGKLEEMLPLADVVTIHAGGAQPLLTAGRIALMKKGAYLINTARGALVDEKALAAALRSGSLAGAALDVHAKEPKKDTALDAQGKPAAGAERFDSPLRGLDNVILTPHIGAATKEAQARIGQDLIAQLKQMLSA